MQVRAHKARKRRRLEPDSFQLEFTDDDLPLNPENSTIALRTARWRAADSVLTEVATHSQSEMSEVGAQVDTVVVEREPEMRQETTRENTSFTAPFAERPPLAPFPRISAPTPKVIEFPRMQSYSYELAEPVADQLRIFEAVEELPPPPTTHLNEIEIAPDEPAHVAASELEIPIQTARLGVRIYAAAVDAAIMIVAGALFATCASFFAGSLPVGKPLLAGGVVSSFLLVTIYYFLSLYCGHGTAGMGASGLSVLTFSGTAPSRTRMGCRALATVLSTAALGMGFAWSLIDEDQLCWHDRITHTYLTSK